MKIYELQRHVSFFESYHFIKSDSFIEGYYFIKGYQRTSGLAQIEADILVRLLGCGDLARSVIEITGTLLALVTAPIGE